jgi:S1-C subfamily serine protease
MSDFDEGQARWVPLEGSGAWVPAASGETGTPQPVWPAPATAGWSHSGPVSPPPPPPGGWWTAPPASSAGPPPSGPPRRRRALPLVLTAALVGVAAVAGLGIGHEAWPTSASVKASAQGSATAPSSSGSGSSGSGTSGSGSSGSGSSGSGGSSSESPFGSGGFQFGSGDSPFSSGGSSSESPFGSGSSSSSGNGSTGSTADTAAVAAKVSPALVDINSTFSYQSAQGAGTGIVLTSKGEILTNNHVVNGATKISVTDIGNGKTYTAKVVGYDDSHDIAVIQLQGASGLKTAQLADSSKAAVGESIVAVGNAGGTGGTPSSAGGSITALNQSITASDDLDGANEQLSGLIQVNADIQPGDSGGSLVNTSGQVLGIDTAASQGYSFQGSASGGEGYAIPIDAALAVAHQIESGQGSATVHVGPTAFLGIELSSSSSQSGLGSSSGSSGATVSGVVAGGPAAQAGLAAGDVVTSLDGHTVDTATTISSLLTGHHPGDKVQIGWVDSSGQSHTATVDLGTGPPA